MVGLQKFKNRITIWLDNSTSTYIPRRTEWSLQEVFAHHVHSSIIHSSQKTEAAPVSLSLTDDGQTKCGVYTQRTMFHSLKKEVNSDMLDNMDEPWGHYEAHQKRDT